MEENKIMDKCKAAECECFGERFCIQVCSENKLWQLKNESFKEWEKVYDKFGDEKLKKYFLMGHGECVNAKKVIVIEDNGKLRDVLIENCMNWIAKDVGKIFYSCEDKSETIEQFDGIIGDCKVEYRTQGFPRPLIEIKKWLEKK